MRAYVINLEKSVERLEKFMSWAPTFFDVRVITAVEGGTRKERQAACRQSHINALEEAIKEDVYPFVIFEDDAEPCGAFDPSIIDSGAKDWPLYLGALPVKNGKRVAIEGKGWVIPSVKLYGAHAIAYKSKEAASRVLVFMNHYHTNADTSLIHFQRRHCVFVYMPLQFYQAAGFSDIDHTFICKR